MFNYKFTHKKIGWENSNLGKRKKNAAQNGDFPRMADIRDYVRMREIGVGMCNTSVPRVNHQY